MTLRDRLQAVAERVRGIPDTLGMRPWSILVRKRTWSGERVGIGLPVDVDVPLHVYFGRANPRIQEVTSKDIVASGGTFTTGDIKVGPITPTCLAAVTATAGGHSFPDVDPLAGALPAEVMFLVTGPGTGPQGTWYKRVEGNSFNLFRMTIVLRATKAKA
jgi:hypothetical protein